MKRQWKVGLLLVAAVVSTVIFAVFTQAPKAAAANPTTMSFQGKVVNANGTNVTDGSYSFVFKLYTVASAGTATWTETQSTVTVTAGTFQVNLGSVCPFFTANACNNNTPIDFNASSAQFLGITFNGDPAGEMTPRVQLQSVPFAYNSDKVGGLSASQLVQLSPGAQQTGFVNVNGAGTFGGTLQSNKFLLGADLSIIPITGSQSVVSTWWGLQLVGNKQTSVDYIPTAIGANGAYGVLIPVQQAASVGLLLSGAATQTGDLLQITSNGGAILDKIDANGNLTVNAAITSSATGGTALTASGAPTNSAVLSLVQLGGAIAGGNTTVNGGTYLGINEPVTGAGSTADFANFQANGVNKFKVDANGDITAAGGLTGGVTSDIKASETVAATYTETTAELGYYLFSNSTTTNVSFSTTFNVTGLPAVDGATASFTAAAAKGLTGNARTHTTIVQIAGVVIATLSTTNATIAQTTSRSFTVMRLNGTWQVTGEGPAAGTILATTSTVNTADYAEWVHYSGENQPQMGEILRAGDESVSVKRSSGNYDSATLGVVSSTPYQIGGADDGHSVVIALAGRVPVKVNLQNGPIAIGDKITASATAGVGMKAIAAGRIIGTALSAYDGSQGSAEVIVQLGIGYDSPAFDNSALVSPALRLDTTNYALPSLGSVTAAQAATGLSVPAAVPAHNDANPTHSTSANNNTNANFFTFDANGNGSIKGNLDVSSAAVTGGIKIGGDVDIAGLSTFQKLATFIGKTVFRQSVQFDGHITVAKDNAGYATLRVSEATVHISFKDAYEQPPVVSATVTNGKFLTYTIDHVDAKGFDISLKEAATADTVFSWTAVGVNDPQTAVNAVPPKT